jgi:hypothetical protein
MVFLRTQFPPGFFGPLSFGDLLEAETYGDLLKFGPPGFILAL